LDLRVDNNPRAQGRLLGCKKRNKNILGAHVSAASAVRLMIPQNGSLHILSQAFYSRAGERSQGLQIQIGVFILHKIDKEQHQCHMPNQIFNQQMGLEY
jgi:hypothetical protein